ncbi:haloacid dehalogenase type II [Paracoccus saliphilus]|uniref:2-haloacid dehalogenase/putative hydrolase of the HAD superfamily n=1 Tax=Paracoccus saliphilus TaxID=405559 RepID=A0AA45W6I6_9RHOB|nr:haloacid dehalogenase type II [Paracoccus saliphilus]WCR04372.1 haloacid dehalogenase type II [Paracoccus saliphilus]SIT02202.1 2-haloacid dehalogenase/putative hydrolase of the HAD superfamily [Paracoccus saliphilus]
MARLRDYTALSFDVYGTLIDWESGMLAGLKPLTDRLGTEMSDDAVLEMHARNESAAQAQTPGRAYSSLLATVYRRCAEELGLAVDWEECERYGASVPDWPAFPDSADALAYLKLHYRMIVLSNVDNRSFAGSARKLGIDWDGVFTAEDIGSYKPAQRNFDYLLAGIERLGIAKTELLHTAESMFHDHVPARANGLDNAWIYRRHQKQGFGATMDPGQLAETTFRFNSLREMAEAHESGSI